MDKQTIEKYRAEFERKADKFYMEYQETGAPGKEKTQHRYENMVDICDLALKEKEEEYEDRQRRVRNMNKHCERLQDVEQHEPGRTYTTQQVINMIREWI